MKSTPHSLFKSTGFAINGLRKALTAERNMKIHCMIALSVTLSGFVLELSSIEWMIICLCFVVVIAAELLNTAIEKLVDLVAPGYSEQAGTVKDIAAGAVLVCALAAAVIGGMIFIPKVWIWLA